ncbi:MAG: DUF3857 domain-containing protein [Bacteroidales bacterium]|nr:DUF3857 domain-containing protein [Bacteroidales bacterium]
MKSYVLFGFLIGVLNFEGLTGEPVFPAYTISDDLKVNANAVIRLSQVEIEIKSDKKATYQKNAAITILNTNGDKYGVFAEFYDKQAHFEYISIRIYDAFGNLIDHVKESKIKDYSAVSGFSLYDDNRIRYYEPTVKKYPYTVVFSYSKKIDGLLQLPTWVPQWGEDIAIESATLSLVSNKDNKYRYRFKNFRTEPVIVADADAQHVTWEIKDLPAFKKEILQPSLYEIVPSVKFAPDDFSEGGYPGNLSSWKNFGTWIADLNEGRDELSETTVAKVRELINGITDTLGMVEKIYKYMQKNTRYVSIQLGIGGFQPIEASVVEKTGYGDCKALSNYTKALLKAVGIRSIYTLVKAGTAATEIDIDFPAQQFNHVILFIPLQSDTIWLECTEQNLPFGYLGKFSEDRWALAITQNGGAIVRINTLNEDQNQKICFGNISINENGAAAGSFSITYTGLAYSNMYRFIHKDFDEQKKWFHENYYVPHAIIENLKVTDIPERIPYGRIDIDLQSNKYASKTGKRLFIPMIPLKTLENLTCNHDERQFEIQMKNTLHISDSVIFTLPEEYILEYIPDPFVCESEFGKYASDIYREGNQVIIVNHLKTNKGTFKAEHYSEFCNFFQNLQKFEKSSIVLRKATD